MIIKLRYAVLLVALSGSGATHALAQSVRIPSDPWFQSQLSFFHEGGAAEQRRRSTALTADEVRVAPGVTLDAPRAWAITTGSRDVIVAVLDDGFFYDHEDVRCNVWHNAGESGNDGDGLARETNGVDDDGNGFVDDVVGWDFAFDDPDPDAYVFDGMDRTRVAPYEHSIPALGIIGACGDNGIGIAGVNWQVSMMLLKIGAQGTPRGEVDTLRITRVARAIRYGADNGARIINWSGFVDDDRPGQLDTLRIALEYAMTRNVLVVMGAGNDGRSLDDPDYCVYPQCFDLPDLLLVAEADFSGGLFAYELPGGDVRGSNWSPERVHIAAIGTNFSTDVRHGRSTYGVSGGTSNAGPVVAGVGALLLAVRPNLSADQLRSALIASATPMPQLAGRVRAGGVVNAYAAVRHVLQIRP